MLGLSIDWDFEISTCDKNIINTNKNFLLIFIIAVLFQEKKLMLIGILLKKQFLQMSKLLTEKDGDLTLLFKEKIIPMVF